ncbi:DUF5071 domain-containing protein [Pedobacter sp.]|jgi:hypothetical protein|uniref:DUF5071 domain-containing protein n=1 Tax=Pedobacter sp. TaxID=1411316 RepID=UPI002CEF6D11|nr:DUF5071 domain-containing protein [Pedobacter sp.]HWW43381.1 DUF5071 domain-containing protein [Pedobacter sp.]
MKNIDYIPKNTSDVAAVERLKYLPFETIRRDVPELLEWLQDGHWEVAEGIAGYLVPHINEITQELLFVLNTNDSMWKYFVLCGLIERSQKKLDPILIKALKRIAEHPSKIDAEDTVDEVAREIIANKVLCG